MIVLSLAISALASACVSPDRPYGDTEGSSSNTSSNGGYGGSGVSIGQGGAGVAMQGEMCASDAGCATRFCVDGVCCESECDGLCMACSAALTGDANGTCTAALPMTDPHDDCADDGADSCKQDGTCNGSGACSLYATGTECAKQTCTGATRTLAMTCDGLGNCQDNGTVACDPYVCVGDACASDCVSDASCQMGQYCDVGTGSCVPKRGNGEGCQAAKPNECGSGSCVDGVCCDTECAGACQACSQALNGVADGTCAPAPDGSDPDGDCAEEGASSCGNDGTCDGAGACRKYSMGTVCNPGSCASAVQTNPDLCDGMGSCVDKGTTVCAPFVCAGTACASICASDAECGASNYCSMASCIPKKAGGIACSGTNQCASGFCVDGYCCSSACSGICQACSAAKKGAGTNGTCGSIIVGADPDSECNDQGSATCGTNGFCNGMGTCGLYASGAVCVASTCTGGTQTNADTCNGTGMCVDAGTKACAPYACGTNACKTGCVIDADCAAGNFCSGAVCTLKKATGSTCAAPNECSSGFCADGYCCNSACSGVCQACSAAKSTGANGTCSPVKTATDPDNECAAQSTATCGTNGFCNGAGACGFHAAGTICVAVSCSISTQANADTCNGSGSCIDAGTKSCAPYICGATSCKTSCATNADCSSGNVCNGNVCSPPLMPQGSPCSGDGECLTGYCVDGYCCDSDCTGSCETCDGTYNFLGNGFCGTIACFDPDNECPNVQRCNGGNCNNFACISP